MSCSCCLRVLHLGLRHPGQAPPGPDDCIPQVGLLAPGRQEHRSPRSVAPATLRVHGHPRCGDPSKVHNWTANAPSRSTGLSLLSLEPVARHRPSVLQSFPVLGWSAVSTFRCGIPGTRVWLYTKGNISSILQALGNAQFMLHQFFVQFKNAWVRLIVNTHYWKFGIKYFLPGIPEFPPWKKKTQFSHLIVMKLSAFWSVRN